MEVLLKLLVEKFQLRQRQRIVFGYIHYNHRIMQILYDAILSEVTLQVSEQSQCLLLQIIKFKLPLHHEVAYIVDETGKLTNENGIM